MANVKISDLSALGTTPTGADVIPITDVSGTPTTKSVTVTNLMAASPVQSVNSATGAVTIDAGNLNDFNFDGNAILGFKASLPSEINTATYIVADSDNGQVLRVNHASGCTVTIPSGLLSTDSTGFNCSFIQVGAGQITFANDGTSVINNRQSHTKTNAQWAAASVVSTANNVFVLAGDTAS